MTFSLQYDTVFGENLELVGPSGRFPMQWNEGNVWTVEAKLEKGGRYHYEVMRDGAMLRRELGQHVCGSKSGADAWLEWPVKRGAGTAVPVFSLRSAGDEGIGDFADLHLLVDWAAATGQSVIQLLPVNDTTRRGQWQDSYPYGPVSSFALHPLYLRLSRLGVDFGSAFEEERAALNALPQLDYPKVFEMKMRYLRLAFSKVGAADMATGEYGRFCRENAFWLDEYAAFCARRDGSEEDFYRWTQYHLDRQFSAEVQYARSKGVLFKGDLPIGVSADSAEAAFHPELFNLDCSAGAPPDFFSANGQNWGFPTYNWEAMEKDDYAWWKARLRKMSEYFAAFRIDHILGWFRIWEIPGGKRSGKSGHFNPALRFPLQELREMGFCREGSRPSDKLFIEDPRAEGEYHPLISPDTSDLDWNAKNRYDALWEDFFFSRNEEFWRLNAEKKIPALLSASPMLPCGEDLGMVPACVQQTMDKYRILSLEIPGIDKGRAWPYLSVCASSTHDMAPLRCSRGGDMPADECRSLIEGILSSDSMLAVLPLQDWMSLDGALRNPDAAAERINNPADPHWHWRWRMHLGLENLCGAKELNAAIVQILKLSGRIFYSSRKNINFVG